MDPNIEIRASGSTEDDTDWSQFTDTDSYRETTSTRAQQEMLLFDVPPQLHPAVSFGVQRVLPVVEQPKGNKKPLSDKDKEKLKNEISSSWSRNLW